MTTADTNVITSFLDGFVCPDCGELRIKTPSGYLVCPNGHGKLIDRQFSYSQLKTAARYRWAATLPEAKTIIQHKKYEFDGRLYDAVPFDKKALYPNQVPTDAEAPEGCILAVVLQSTRVHVKCLKRIRESDDSE